METKTSRGSRLDLSRTETELFIGYYLAQECLWNLQHVQYSKRDHRIAAQTMISQQMSCHGREMTIEQVSAKISSLRTYYGRELKKINSSEKSGAGVDEVYKSTWEFFPLLDPFLRCHVQQRQSFSNMVKDETVTQQSASVEHSESPTEEQATEDQSHQDSSVLQPTPVPSKKKKVSTPTGDMEQIVVRSLLAIEEKNKSKVDRLNDADYLFGSQIGLEIKKITNPRMKQQLKLKIQQLMYDFMFENEQ